MTERFTQPEKLDKLSMDDRNMILWDMEYLELTEEDITHKDVLDIGSGDDNFKRILSEIGVETNVIGLDAYQNDVGQIKGLAQRLPFRDKSFDLVISRCCVPVIFKNGELEDGIRNSRDSILEAVRVARMGAELHFSPVPTVEFLYYDAVQDVQLIEFLKTLKPVVEEICTDPRLKLVDFSPTLIIKINK